ncbi:MAG: alkylhydroperoxidase [Pseudonocardiales bacterium]|nr:MAG: alkylhydroperoxidase [Pseudonocardiales bacterium]
MTWIATVAYDDADDRVRRLYDRVAGPGGNVDNIMMVHSLRPHTMEGHLALYKNVLHHSANTVPVWFLETLGVWVSSLNNCAYCVEHHYAGLRRLVGDDERCAALRQAITAGDIESAPLDGKQKLAMRYAETLTLAPSTLTEQAVRQLRGAGFTDGEILEINQVCAYFAYANRTVLGLGCSTDGDVLGLSPGTSDNPIDWHHS